MSAGVLLACDGTGLRTKPKAGGAPRPWNASVSETFERAVYPLVIVPGQSTVAFLQTG